MSDREFLELVASMLHHQKQLAEWRRSKRMPIEIVEGEDRLLECVYKRVDKYIQEKLQPKLF